MLAVVGMVARVLIRRHEDVTLAAYLCAASFVVLVSPYQESRYLFTITPLLALLRLPGAPGGGGVRGPPGPVGWLRVATLGSADRPSAAWP